MNVLKIVSIALLLIAGCAGPDSEVGDTPEGVQSEALLFGSADLRELWEAREARRAAVIDRWLRRLCTDRDGSYKCACDPWFNPDAVDCSGGAVNECALGTDNCSDDATCTNTAAAFSCACNDGYDGDGVTCTDIDECTAGSDDCAAEATCSNEPGSYSCECPPGTNDTNGDGTVCTTASCPDGYADTLGDGTQCDDIDECADGSDNCSANAQCANTPGAFTCTCNAGYSGDGMTCTDVNECTANTDNCNTNATCSNTAGGFGCACHAGYAGDGVTCTAIDQCADNDCDANARCEATATSYACICNAGYSGDGRSCADVNECTANTDNCNANAACANTAGSFSCACNAGYAGNGVTCTDVNECTANTDNCNANAACTNTAGSFSCACNAGYAGNGVTCTDVNECTANTDNCSPNATCTNTAGAFRCACNTGYTGNGVTCTAAGCNLTGTFAMLTELDIEWDAVRFGSTIVLAGGSDTVYSYGIRKLSQSGTTVTADVTSCQGSSPDICSPLFGEAYAQVLPDSIWDRPTMPITHVSMTVTASPQPGDPFVSPNEATLLGVTMADPFAAWPSSYTDPLLTWVDHDGDMKPGVTSIMLAGAESGACGLPYADLPIPSSGQRAHEVYTGSRTIAGLDGALVSCDVIQGELTGPNAGMPLLQGHVGGCMRPDGACTAAEVASLDSNASGTAQRVLGARFTMVRVDDDITCAQMSTVTFPTTP